MNTGARDTPARDSAFREGESLPQLYLPDFCRARAVLAIVIICELTALVLALARNQAALIRSGAVVDHDRLADPDVPLPDLL